MSELPNPARLLFLKPVPRFVGMKGEYGPFEPGDVYEFRDEPFAEVLIYRKLAVLTNPAPKSTKKKVIVW